MHGASSSDTAHIVAIERACSALSLLGCVFVLVTFSAMEAFRQRAINRMVFYATFGNMLTNMATLMTTSYTHMPDSVGCQMQGFLIQVFMQSDAYWALAMAINVYLTFYHKYDARMLRKMELFYLLTCYGIPFIPGFVFIFVSNPSMGRPYGDAVLWCWLKSSWEVYRVATFYGPVWVAIIACMIIYIRAGAEIYRQRRKMLNFSTTGNGTVVGNDTFFPAHEFSSVMNYKTTEVTQTTEIVHSPTTRRNPDLSDDDDEVPHPYSVTISAEHDQQAEHTSPTDDEYDTSDNATLPRGTPRIHRNNSVIDYPNNNISPGRLSIAPTVTATITASLGTPTLTAPDNITTTTTGTTLTPTLTKTSRGGKSSKGPSSKTTNNPHHQTRNQHYESHNATWSYTKCALLFFSVLLITWIPSSGNRVYSIIHEGEVSPPLFYASAAVLPLQGFWNAIIYVVTSWAACRELGREVKGWVRERREELKTKRGDGEGAQRDGGHRDGGVGDGIGPGAGGKRGSVVGMWLGRGEVKTKSESTSMEDLTGEGRAVESRGTISPV
ncbi:hypothetical protein B0J18DRAFT_459970 [Chaetomium sp. MPI-SDFR-AT-0129]|nr:hypothetical protein B0J18DRAFT_459970 [Chaetomium sp. MPI-SDFR-AT-0129]